MKNIIYLGVIIIGIFVGIGSLINNFIFVFFISLLAILISFNKFDEKSIFESKLWFQNHLKLSYSSFKDNLVDYQPLYWILISVLFVVVTIIISKSSESRLISIITWGLSILSIFIAGWQWDRPKLKVKNLFGRGTWINNRKFWIEYGGLALLTIFAFILRTIDLADLPKVFHGDEGEIGVLARYALTGSQPLPPFGTSWLHMPNITFYSRAISLFIFGDSVFGLRIISAILGSASIPLVYFIGKRSWGILSGFLAAWLIAVSHFHIHYSRIGLNNIESSFFMILFLFSINALWKNETKNQLFEKNNIADGNPSYKNEHFLLYISIGFIVGFSQYYYIGSKLIPIMAVIYFVFLLVIRKTQLTKVFISLLTAIIIFAPQAAYSFRQPETLLGRFDGVSIFSDQNVKHTLGVDAYLPRDLTKLIKHQIENNFDFFITSGDTSAFYFPDVPAFDTLTKLFFWIGLGIAAMRMKRFPEFQMVTLFFVGLFFAGFMTNDSPNGPRLLILIPSVFLLGGMAFDKLIGILNSIINNQKLFVMIMVIPILIFTTYTNLHYYFDIYQQQSFGTSYYMASEFKKYKDDYDLFIIGEPFIYAGHGTFKFIVGENIVQDLNDRENFNDQKFDDGGIFIISVNENFEMLDEFIKKNPGGYLLTYAENNIPNSFYSYRIPPP